MSDTFNIYSKMHKKNAFGVIFQYNNMNIIKTRYSLLGKQNDTYILFFLLN